MPTTMRRMAEFEHLRNTKQHRRREFAVQKAKFRDFLKTLEHKWTPLVVIKLHHMRFGVGGCNMWVQYQAFKAALKNGLQVYLLQNARIKALRLQAEQAEQEPEKNQKRDNIDKRKITKQDRGKKRDKKSCFMLEREVVDLCELAGSAGVFIVYHRPIANVRFPRV